MAARVVDLRKGKQKPAARSRPLPFPDQALPKRPAPLRTRRRRARLAALGMFVILMMALAYAVHLVSYTEPLSISAIRVTGAERVDPAIIETYVDTQLRTEAFRYISPRNMFAYPKESLEQGIIASFPRISDASVSRETLLAKTIDVHISERSPFALWCTPLPADTGVQDCYALDETGFIFTASATSTHGEFETAYTFTGGVEDGPVGAKFVPGQFPSVLALLRVLQQSTSLIPVRVDVLPEQDFNVTLEQGFYVKLSFGQDAQTIARNLNLVLSSDALRDRTEDIEYIDLRFGNRVYYKMKGQEQTNI